VSGVTFCHHNTARAAACHPENSQHCVRVHYAVINRVVLIGSIITAAAVAAVADAHQAADGNVEPADCALSSSSVLSAPSV
jgi:hypothetical protein